jgi:hypothetical protein
VALGAVGFVRAKNAERQPANQPGLIQIRSMQAFGELELPAVRFDHDVHTDALAGQGKACATCHPQVNGSFVFTFSQLQAAEKQDAKALYHDRCVSCHRTQKEKGRDSGPLEGECRSCHRSGSQTKAAQPEAGMDLTLHAEHLASLPNKDESCGRCHHFYDPKSQKLVHTKGHELGCRACHGEDTRTALSSLSQAPAKSLFTPRVSPEYLAGGEPPSWSQAAHLSCLNCHLQARTTVPDQDFQGPVSCRGCHSRTQKPAQDTLTVPRLERGQPDATFIAPALADMKAGSSDSGDPGLMHPVPFDHKLHEQSADTCRRCHHQSRLESCTKCHGLQASEEGGMITLDQAMHSPESEQSCVGCHRQQAESRPECAGCHLFRAESWGQDTDTCLICHDPRSPGHQELLDMSSGERSTRAQNMRALRDQKPPDSELKPLPQEFTIQLDSEAFGSLTFPVRLSSGDMAELREKLTKAPEKATPKQLIQNMPREVTIDRLSEQYGPVRFPHARIALALLKGIGSDSLAQAFHQDRFTLCQGCHHQSPPSANPPACASCHAQPFASTAPDRPGLKAAYHRMCMDCHDRMEIDEPANTDCSACHAQQKHRIISDIK